MSPPPSIPKHVEALISRARTADGQPPFSDQSLVELGRGERALVEITQGEAVVGAAIVGADEFELVVDPESRGTGHGTALLNTVVTEHPAAVFAWAHGDHPAARALANTFGFEPVRTLLQLHAPVAGVSLGRETRVLSAFVPGIDDTAWLALNSRAFADHPEQGGLTQHDLDDRTAENWFNAGDFLILRDGDQMIGFCWLKIAESPEGDLGEFYAVGMDPERQGEGLGRVLMDAGFARLAERGIRTANLYVEADNEPALALYDRYGFQQHTIDVRYQRRGY